MTRTFASWRGILLTAGIAATAGFFGAWAGKGQLSSEKVDSFPTTVSDLITADTINLKGNQKTAFAQLTETYQTSRLESTQQLRKAMVHMAKAMTAKDNYGTDTDAAAKAVDRIVHERRVATILYIMDARKILDAEQKAHFDQNFLKVVNADPTY